MNAVTFVVAAICFAIYLVCCIRLWCIRNSQSQSKYMPASAIMPFSAMISIAAGLCGSIVLLKGGLVGSFDDTGYGWLKITGTAIAAGIISMAPLELYIRHQRKLGKSND